METPIRSIVIGPTEHTRVCLEEILRTAGYSVEAVFGLDTSHRHKKARWTTFDDLAERYKFRLVYDTQVKKPENIAVVKEINPDVIFEFGASEIVPKEILDIPRYGVIGSHGGPLPYYKGGSSLNWALIRDEKEWGVSLYYLAEKADEGDIIGVSRFEINDRDDIATLHQKSDYHIQQLLRKTLVDLRDKGSTNRTTPTHQGIFLPQRKPKDGQIDWNKPAREIFNFIRAQTHPFPGAYTHLSTQANPEGKKVYIWQADYNPDSFFDTATMQNGLILRNVDYQKISGIQNSSGIIVKSQLGDVIIKKISMGNDPEMWADDFVSAYGLNESSKFYRKIEQ